MRQRLLLITPTFHGYYKSIVRALEGIDYDVTAHCYDAFNKVQDKILNKALFELPAKVGLDGTKRAEQWATARALKALEDARPHKVVVIKGDSLGSEFWTEIERLRIPRILWLYDDLARHRYEIDFLQRIGPVVSYSRDEATVLASKGVNATFLPNAFDPTLAAPPIKRNPEIVFVGSRYPNRVTLLEGLRDQGIPVRAYGRQWSSHPFDRLRTWEVSRPDLPSERDIPLFKAYVVQAEAAAAINIHGLQAGLAMRTFEVPGMGGLQLIDRPDVAEFYEPGVESLVFENPEHLTELAARALTDKPWAGRLREAGRKRTLAEHTFAHRMPILEALWD